MRGTDFDYNQLRTNIERAPFRGFTAAEYAGRAARRGDLIVEKSGGGDQQPVGRVVLHDHDEPVIPTNFAARLRPAAGVDSRFACYLMASLYSDGRTKAAIKQTTGIQNLDLDALLADLVSVPELTQQGAIADYLDAETARIDALVAKKRRMVHLTQERFVTLVSCLTEAGSETRVRHVTSLVTSGPRGWAELVSNEGSPFIRSANLQRASVDIKTDNLVHVLPPKTLEARRSSVCCGDVVMGITGANTGWVGCVPQSLAGGFVSQHVAILRPKLVEPGWLAYSLFSVRAQDQLLGGQYGGTKQQLGLEDLAELRIANPDRVEQRRRVVAIMTAERKSKGLIELLDRQIALLVEHRQALVTAAVTGELDVPVVAA